MRLITHNMLKSNIKGVEKGFPLGIEVLKKEEQELEFNSEFISNMLAKLDWAAFRTAAIALEAGDLPEELTEEMKGDEEMLRKVHHALMEVHLVEGELVCPETGRKFPVRQGVPNMLLHED
ncbi:unnamed protein product, partial [Hapterophycus canaliculatus]